MYKIIGADKKEYGPVTAAQLHQWISEGRANAQSQVQLVGSADWNALGTFPEFIAALRVHNEPVAPPAPPPLPMTPQEVLEGDYDLDIVGCISRGWALFKDNMGVLFGGFIILAALSIVTHAVLNWIIGKFVPEPATHTPAFMLLSAYGSLVITALVQGPLIGGFYCLILYIIRGQARSADTVFSGFQNGFMQLVLGYIVTCILVGLSFIPFNIIFAQRTDPILQQFQNASADQMSTLMPKLFEAFSTTMPYFLIGLIPAIYFSTCLIFTMPLIADKKMRFGAAMKLSWQVVNKHWWLIFGLTILISLLNVLGCLCCFVGLLFTIPVGLVASIVAYESIFSGRKPQDH